MMMIHVWICYTTASWVLDEAWTTSNRGESPHRPRHDLQLHPEHAQLLPWVLNPVAWTMDLGSGLVIQGWWYIYGYVIPLLHECYMTHEQCLIGVNHPRDHSMASNFTLDLLCCYPCFRKIRVNSVPQQWCSEPRMMTHIWICYPTVWWRLYETLTMTDRGESPQRPHHDLQLHPWHAQMLPWFTKRRAWTMYFTSCVVVQERWGRYEYATPLLDEYYIRHYGPCLTGVDLPKDHIMTSNYTPDMLSPYPSSRIQDLEPCTTPVVKWPKDDCTCMDMLYHYFMIVIWGRHYAWQRWITP